MAIECSCVHVGMNPCHVYLDLAIPGIGIAIGIGFETGCPSSRSRPRPIPTPTPIPMIQPSMFPQNLRIETQFWHLLKMFRVK